MQNKVMHHKFQITIQWTPWYPPPNDTTHKQAIEQESVNSFIFFYVKYHGTGL